MTTLYSRPAGGRDTDAAVDTEGEAYSLLPSVSRPIKTKQVAVYVSALAFVGFGVSATPPAPTTANTIYQEAETVVPYVLTGNDAVEKYLYVYAVTDTILVRVSMFG